MAALLQEALRERGVEVVVSALVNDTVGTLMAKSYVEPRCRVGVILGETKSPWLLQEYPANCSCTAGGLHACVFVQRALVLVWPLFSCARRLQARGRTQHTWSGAPPSPSGWVRVMA